MEAQLRLRGARLAAGEKHLGWKVGFGAPESMQRLGIDAPLVGYLTDKTLVRSGATVSITGWTRGVAEPEVAIYLGQDLPGDSDREAARTAIASLGPAIELADVSFPADDIEAVLVGNIYNRYEVLGRADASRAGCLLDGLVGRVARDGAEVAAVADLQALTGDYVDTVRHVADVLAACGERLRAGDVIITGSIIPPIRLGAREEIRFTLDLVDTISVRLEP
jgi:2-keto-4-pentenoate hydratase